MQLFNPARKHHRILTLLSVAFIGMVLLTCCQQKSDSRQAVATDLDTVATAENNSAIL
jgi:hypothetical protein